MAVIYHVLQRPGTDAIAAKLAASDTVQFDPGTFTNSVAIQPRDGCRICGSSDARSPSMVTTSDPNNSARPVDAVRIVHAVSRASIADFVASTQGKESSAVSVSGSDCTLTNITQDGAGRVLTFNSAQRLVADMLIGTSGNIREYGVWGAHDGDANTGPIDCTLKRFDLNITQGEHGIRAHKHTNLILGDERLSLAGFDYAGRIVHTAPFAGAAITLKEGKNARIIRVWTNGPVGFGPLPIELPSKTNTAGSPGWQSLRLDGLVIEGCCFNVRDRYLAFDSSVINVLMKDSQVIASSGSACLMLGGPAGPNHEWPAASGVFQNVKFTGAKLCGDSNKPLLTNWTFNNCTLNGKVVGMHGE